MRKFKGMIAFLLCIMLLFSGMVSVFAESETSDGGTFYLTASKTSKTLIEPVRVSYTAGQTIREALAASKFDFGGIDQGYIYSIEGEAGNFYIYYENGAYDLDVPASVIKGKALCFSEHSNYSEEVLDLVIYLAQYLEREDNVQKYDKANKAYQNAIKGVRSADAAKATELKQALKESVVEYEALMKGEKYTVNFSALQGGNAVTDLEIVMTDLYGNVTKATGTSVKVIAGTYTFCISDGGWNRTEGTIKISENQDISVELPSGEWFGDIKLLDNQDAVKSAYAYTQDAATHTAVYSLPDTAGWKSIILNVGMGDVPDEDTTKLRTIYIGTNGEDKSTTARSWESKSTSLTYLVGEGLEGRTFDLEAQYTNAAGHKMIQSYTLTIERIPTLSGLTVTGDGTKLPIAFSPTTESYNIVTVSDTLEIAAKAFGETGYEVTGAGTLAVSGDTVHNVTVCGENGKSRTYVLNITKKDSVAVTANVPEGSTAAILNSAEAEVMPVDGTYHLIPGESYTCVITKDKYYHTAYQFTAKSGLVIEGTEPETKDALTNFVLYDARTASMREEYAGEFTPAQHAPSYVIPDADTALYAQATTIDGYTATALYDRQSLIASTYGLAQEIKIENSVSTANNATYLSYCLAKCGYHQDVVIRLEKTVGDVRYYQDYNVLLRRKSTLKSLTVSDEQETLLTLLDENGDATTFDRDVTEYRISVMRDAQSLILNAEFQNVQDATPVCGGYYAEIGEKRYDAIENAEITLDTAYKTETIEVKICHADSNLVATIYQIIVEKTDPVYVTFATTPGDAILCLQNSVTGERIWPEEDGTYALTPGGTYNYTVTRNGYVGQQVTEYIAPESNATVTLSLTKAPTSPNLNQLDAEWPYFRADKYNNGVVNSKTPTTAEESVLYWATKLGDGFDTEACGCPIIVDGYLYTYGGSKIFKVDTVSGEIVKVGTMDHTSSFAINSPAYADGMLFVGLANGGVQAFNATTLESLWLYEDPLGGQPNCPIVYHDGYIYTGFWSGEMSEASFVCLNVTDEDPNSAKESKLATWRTTELGGFYWAGAYVCDDYVVVGTDDGKSGYTTGYSRVKSFDPKSGKPIDSVTLSQTGDLRSSISFVPDSDDTSAGKAYFTTKGGNFYELTIDAKGKFQKLRNLKLYNYADDPTNPAMSTCTPVIYNGRAYIGVSGTGQFSAYSGHNITVIDLKTWDIAYTVRTQGYPQTSGLLTTAYEKDTGYVYIYFIDNYTPGKVRVLRDKPGQTEADMFTQESITIAGETLTYNTGQVLFTPYDQQAQYAICSPITDEYGTLYFKNDSAYMMAVGSTIEKIEITKMPDKLVYAEGETFDPEGMEVMATYTNGKTRDITKYVTWLEDPLTAEDAEFRITFPYVMYQNQDGEAGVKYPEPTITLMLQIGGGLPGDVNGDGMVNATDASLVLQYAAGSEITLNTAAADVNGDGMVNATDASLILQYAAGVIESFSIE